MTAAHPSFGGIGGDEAEPPGALSEPPDLEYYVGRLERREAFAFVKRTAGFWDLLVAAADHVPKVAEFFREAQAGRRSGTELPGLLDRLTPEEAATLESKHKYRHFWADGFVADLVRDLQSPHSDPSYFEALEQQMLLLRGPRAQIYNVAETSDRLLHDAFIWKNTAKDGSFASRFLPALHRYRVVVVGPAHLAYFGAALGLARFEHLEIHPRRAIGDREEILARLLDSVGGEAGRDAVVLFQAGGLAYWLIYRLWPRTEASLIDVGQAIDPWCPEASGEIKWFLDSMAVDEREVDIAFVDEALEASRAANHWTNFAPVSLRLESRVAEILELPPDRKVVATANGTLALHALAYMASFRAGRSLRWVVPGFSFRGQRTGPFTNARVVDCDASGFLDLEQVERLDPASYDGIVVTHMFGRAAPVDEWEQLAARIGKLLLFDSATCLGSTYGDVPIGRFGTAEAFSLHQSKPLGAGEGGCVTVPADWEDDFRAITSCGLYKHLHTGPLSLNAKMSDFAAAFVLERLHDVEAVRAAQREQFERIAGIGISLGYELLVTPEDPRGLPSAVALLAPRPVAPYEFVSRLAPRRPYVVLGPGCPRAEAIHERLLCLPCDRGLAAVSDEWVKGPLRELVR